MASGEERDESTDPIPGQPVRERSLMLRLIQGARPSTPQATALRHDELAHLAERVVAGEKDALRTFLAVIVPHLLRVVRRVLGPSHADVEDATQEAAMAVVQALPSFRQEGTVLHFACRIGVLTAMNLRRREAAQKRARSNQAAFDLEEVPGEELGPEREAQITALAPVVRELLDSLSEPLAEALALHCILGYTVSEVAETCGVPGETVRSRLRLAKQALRKRVMSDPFLRQVVEVDP
jgi:RNA polymerase sigma factor (sigma-70 family)